MPAVQSANKAAVGEAVTDAHSVTQHLTIQYTYPAHEPRRSDPHYKAFNAARRRLERLGALKCWIGNGDCSHEPIELHHSTVEFSLANIVDVQHFAALYPEFRVESDEDFLAAIESEAGMLPLCLRRHRGDIGIHSILYSPWLVQRFKKADAPLPAQRIKAD